MMANFIDRALNKLMDTTSPYVGWFRRLYIKSTDFTIISNNCWGGRIYKYFNLPYQSPTVGLYFYADDYIRFLSNLKWYLQQELKFITWEESKYKDSLYAKGQTNIPIGCLNDVEIVFLHYKTKEEASEKWIRRTKRINWNNLYVKFSEMNNCTKEHLEQFERLCFERKIVFVSEDYGLKNQVIFKEYAGQHNVPDDTTRLKHINPIRYINQ